MKIGKNQLGNLAGYGLVFLLGLLTVALLQAAPSFLDPDSFYHAKLAELTAQEGVVTNFPWLPLTVLNNYYIDQHLLYHFLLVPFLALGDPLVALKVATIFLAVLFFLTFYWFLRRTAKNLPVWVAVGFTWFLLLSKPFMFRLNLAKAPALSLIFLLVGWYLIVRRRYFWLFIFSAFYVSAYGGWSLILVVLAAWWLVGALSDYLELRREWWQKFSLLIKYRLWPRRWGREIKLLARSFFGSNYLKLFGVTMAGLLVGLVASPYFPKNLSFYYQQLVEIGIINYQKVVRVGLEWYPYGAKNLLLDLIPLASLLLVALAVFICSLKQQSRLAKTSLVLTIFFLAITLKSQRYVEYLVPLAMLFCVLALAPFLTKEKIKVYWQKILEFYWRHMILTNLLVIIWLTMAATLVANDWRDNWRLYHGAGRNFNDLRHSIIWLTRHARPQTVVFHSDWDEFPQLFYYNDANYYIAGLDPTFLYKANPATYKMVENITLGRVKDGLAGLIEREFGAEYIFVEIAGHDQLLQNLEKAKDILPVYHDNQAKIFKIIHL